MNNKQIAKDELWKNSDITVSCKTDSQDVISSIQNINQVLQNEFDEESGHCEGNMMTPAK